MKILLSVTILLVLFVSPATAEMQFPQYESLSQEIRSTWGYTLERSSSADGYTFFDLTIPQKAAKFVMDAHVDIRDKQKQVLVSMDVGLFEGTDGNLHARIELHRDFGSAELVVRTKQLPESPFLGDFGGFTFSIPPQAKAP